MTLKGGTDLRFDKDWAGIFAQAAKAVPIEEPTEPTFEDLQRWFIESNVPPRHRGLTRGNFAHVSETFDLLVKGKTSMLLLGPQESGKTGLAYAVMVERYRAALGSTSIVKASLLLESIKGLCYNGHKALDTVIRHNWGRSVDLLFIDEIDKPRFTESDFQILFDLVDYRYEWDLATVVMGNGDLATIRARIGQSVYSRLTGEGGKAVIMPDMKWRRRQTS